MVLRYSISWELQGNEKFGLQWDKRAVEAQQAGQSRLQGGLQALAA
jgi:hypothetical protein